MPGAALAPSDAGQ